MCPLERVRHVETVHAAGAEVLRPGVATEGSAPAVRRAADTADDPSKHVVQDGSIRRVEESSARIAAQVHDRVLGDIDPVLTVGVDGVVRDRCLRRALDVDAMPDVVADRVPGDAAPVGQVSRKLPGDTRRLRLVVVYADDGCPVPRNGFSLNDSIEVFADAAQMVWGESVHPLRGISVGINTHFSTRRAAPGPRTRDQERTRNQGPRPGDYGRGQAETKLL